MFKGVLRRRLLVSAAVLIVLFVLPRIYYAIVGAGVICAHEEAVLLFMDGPFGALIIASAGVGAIVIAALCEFRAVWCLVILAVVLFLFRSHDLMELVFFGDTIVCSRGWTD